LLERPNGMVNWLLRACTCSLLLITSAVAVAAVVQPQAGEQAARSARSAILAPDLMERLIERSHPLRAADANTQQWQRLDGLKAPASLQAVVIMVDFADSCFYGRQDEFDGPLPTSTQSSFYYAAHDSVYYDHLVRDVADYYDAASGGRFQLHYTVHGRIVGLDEGMAFYGNHPEFGEQPVRLAADAIAALDAEIDFSLYDTVILIHAGAGQETDILNNSPEQIYSTYLGPDAFARAVEDSILAEPYIATADFPEGDGVRHVLILPETQFQDPYDGFSGHFGSLGTYCFVVGLRLGMLSLSDFTPPGAPDSQGVGQFCLMGYGLFAAGGYVPPHPCAFNKQLMGWLDPYLVDPDLGATWTLHSSAAPEHPLAAARIDLTGSEYYLLEYRLQDPDGNGIFSFAGDLNGNNVPDFYDMSNVAGGGVPTRFFDPQQDIRERMVGAEWDFFLSDNPARAPGVKGAGSGIYIWHIDEGVIRDVFGLRRNLFNADPRRKAVDLVEADGIQDLDSRQPSPYWLGGDDDSFRGEGNSDFGPDTRPATRTNGGLRTGLVIDQISNVVVDSSHVFHAGTDSAYVGIRYAETMTFRCRREADPDAPVMLHAARDLPGVDLVPAGGCGQARSRRGRPADRAGLAPGALRLRPGRHAARDRPRRDRPRPDRGARPAPAAGPAAARCGRASRRRGGRLRGHRRYRRRDRSLAVALRRSSGQPGAASGDVARRRGRAAGAGRASALRAGPHGARRGGSGGGRLAGHRRSGRALAGGAGHRAG
jgi:hypothetical protein